nr:MAG TPA: tail fiber protein [Caudoviricetes sp.]
MADLGQVVVMPKGKYDPIMQYNALDMIEHKGSSYIAKQTTVGNEPSETSEYWQLSSRGIEGLANNLTTKESGKYALDASMGELLERKKADRTTQHPVILLATNWTGESAPYTYTIELEEITADNTITLVPAEDITAEQYTALQSAQIEDAEQTAGTIILQAQHKPAIDIPILVLIGDTSVPSAGGGATIPLINHLLTENAGVGALDAAQGMVLDNKIACLSNPNLLINPDFRINQRGQDSYVEVNGYTVDRWVSYNTLNVLSNGIKILNSKNEAALIWIKQNFETMLNGIYTASIKLRKNRANMPLVLQCGNFVKDTIPNTEWQIISLTMNGAFDYIQLITADSIDTDYIEIEWVKLEVGSLATPFVPPDPATELLKCQRYYEKIDSYVVLPYADGGLSSIPFKVEKRLWPTVKLEIKNAGSTATTSYEEVVANCSCISKIISSAVLKNDIGYYVSGTVDAEIY